MDAGYRLLLSQCLYGISFWQSFRYIASTLSLSVSCLCGEPLWAIWIIPLIHVWITGRITVLRFLFCCFCVFLSVVLPVHSVTDDIQFNAFLWARRHIYILTRTCRHFSICQTVRSNAWTSCWWLWLHCVRSKHIVGPTYSDVCL